MNIRPVRGAILIAVVAGALSGSSLSLPHTPPAWSTAVAHAGRLAPDARILVLDSASGGVLAASRLAEAARTLAAPGSALKPLVLYRLIQSRRWNPDQRIACTRKLTVAGRSLNCSHPPSDPMDARQALAWSCNTYFATLAGSLAPGELRSLLAPMGILGSTGLAAPEATAVFNDPQTPNAERLAVLGVDGILVTPLELATAYRWLALQLASQPDSQAAQTVRAGLADSTSFGMAGAASLGGVPIAGKTGTASPAAGTQTHGWFAGVAPSDAPRVVIVVYLPAAHGADAARVAAELLAHSPLRHP